MYYQDWQQVPKTANRPSEKYLKTIVNGLKETYNLTKEEIVEYLIKKNGVKEYYNSSGLI
ncbi:hypothetical protein ciss_07870 [Carboxydothermus islandicus]|uniref:Uncharacterized protein n=1 Tax=Carboxydothermus islandicus TaxID=661089 RepID=A0A1L8D136_9THEO|nr:hypothetical protein [Carboxydothermus islandicus]GAV24854.1 hypothetical protein ciss_07870 [Carboxydothermus islandicus]